MSATLSDLATARMDAFDFPELVRRIEEAGHADDITWSETVVPPTNSRAFAAEAIFVICNSGMHHKVAMGIYERVMHALEGGRSASTAFRHAAKCRAIDHIWASRVELLLRFREAAEPLAWLRTLPHIGPVTVFHLAKNVGLQVAKPDVHLVRLANTFRTTPQALCESIAARTGYKVATVDTVLWRAAAIGLLDTRSGLINAAGQL